jgi:hypothetical protein
MKKLSVGLCPKCGDDLRATPAVSVAAAISAGRSGAAVPVSDMWAAGDDAGRNELRESRA